MTVESGVVVVTEAELVVTMVVCVEVAELVVTMLIKL